MVALAVFIPDGAPSQEQPPQALRIPRRQPQAGGISLARPSKEEAAAARITRDDAERIALAAVPGVQIIETALAIFRDGFDEPFTECLCWAVSLDVADFPPASGGGVGPDGLRGEFALPVGYSLIIVDAVTGQPLTWRSGGDPPN